MLSRIGPIPSRPAQAAAGTYPAWSPRPARHRGTVHNPGPVIVCSSGSLSRSQFAGRGRGPVCGRREAEERRDCPSVTDARPAGHLRPATPPHQCGRGPPAANRRNAKRSTGPRSAAGKAICAANARRHGLSVAAPLDHETARVHLPQARAWAGPGASPMLLDLAQNWAEAEFELARVREARAALWKDWPSEPVEVVRRLAAARPALAKLERYLKRAEARRRKAM